MSATITSDSPPSKSDHERKSLSKEDFECPICGQIYCSPVTTPCCHTFCQSCITVWLAQRRNNTCPSCRGIVDSSIITNINENVEEDIKSLFPDEWKARMFAGCEETKTAWLEQLPFLLCPDPECGRMLRNMDSVIVSNKSLSLASPRIAASMLILPRKWFLPPSMKESAYRGLPVRLETLRFNVSAPEVYCSALELLDLKPGHAMLDVGSGCGLLTCLAGTLVSPGGSALGVDIRNSAISFSRANLERAKLKMLSLADKVLGSALFEGSIHLHVANENSSDSRPCVPPADFFIASDSNPFGIVGDRALLRVTRGLDDGRFEASLARGPPLTATSLAISFRSAEWSSCVGTLSGTSVSLEETGNCLFELALHADGVLSGTWKSICTETGAENRMGSAFFRPVSDAGVLVTTAAAAAAALNGGVEFLRANVFDFVNEHNLAGDGQQRSEPSRMFDRIHVGATIPPSRAMELYRLLRPGGILVGPLCDHMVVVQRRDITAVGASGGDDEEFVVRSTAAVRYGDLIEPGRPEAQEMEADRAAAERRARRLLEGTAPVDFLCCRACGATMGQVGSALDAADVFGEDIRLDGAGACLLLPSGGFSVAVEEEGLAHVISRFDCASARAASCKACGLFLGFRLDAGIGLLPAEHVGDLCVPRAFLSVRTFSDSVTFADSSPAAATAKPPGRAVLCAGEGCGSRLTSTKQLLSRRHQWRLSSQGGRNSEPALFVNALEAGTTRVGDWSRRHLAQGPMQCAPLFCAACDAEVGWAFGEPANESAGLQSYVGRFGLVQSCIAIAPTNEPATATAGSGAGDDWLENNAEEADDDGGIGSLRRPLSLLRQIFALQRAASEGEPGDTLQLDLGNFLSSLRR